MARRNSGHGGNGRRYHVKHMRARSHYRSRLESRGLARPPALIPLDVLRKRQASDAWLSAHPTIRDNLTAMENEPQAA
jgi:hypothetical protein